jgi:hypothetical protein
MNLIYHQRDVDSRAGQALARYALETNRRCILFSDASEIPNDYEGLVSGSVETVQTILKRKVKPDYLPSWALPFAGRKISYVKNLADLPKVPSFLKPSDLLKRFDGFLWNGIDELNEVPPFEVQSPVEIISECRYYVTLGRVVSKGWYSPTLIDEIDSPDLPRALSIPNDWSGTIDCAKTTEHDSIIIEGHHPFSCGWYGESSDFMIFGKWLEDGWNYMKSITD